MTVSKRPRKSADLIEWEARAAAITACVAALTAAMHVETDKERRAWLATAADQAKLADPDDDTHKHIRRLRTNPDSVKLAQHVEASALAMSKVVPHVAKLSKAHRANVEAHYKALGLDLPPAYR
jgi:hypothetical protein